MDIGLDKNGFLHADDLVFPGVEVARRGRSGRTQGQAHRRAAEAGPGDPGPGDQGPAEDQGPAPVDAALDRGALPRVRAAGRGRRACRAGSTTRSATGCAAPPARSTSATAARSCAPPRRAPSARTSSARSSTCTSSTTCSSSAAKETAAPAMVFQEADLSVRVARDIFSGEFEKAIVDDAQAAPPARVVLQPHRAGAAGPARVLQGRRAAVRALRRGGGDPVGAPAPGGPAERRLPDDRLRRGHDGHRRELRLVHRPRQGREARGHDHADEPRGGRRGREASCGCATSAGSSSSTSSTWRGRATATPC